MRLPNCGMRYAMSDVGGECELIRILIQMKAIKLVTGVTPTCWRPPFGDVDVSHLILGRPRGT